MIRKTIISVVFSLMVFVGFGPSYAQTSGSILEYPPKYEQIPGLMVLKNQLNAQIDYIGRKYSVDMWLASKDGSTQIIYTTLDGRGLLTNGFLFDSKGSVVTEKEMADVNLDEPSAVIEQVNRFKGELSPDAEPSKKLWNDLSKSFYISYGAQDAPVLYMFADPRCPYCKKHWHSLEPFIDSGDIQVRVILVGILGKMSVDVASNLMSEIDKQGAWISLANGTYEVPDNTDKTNIPLVNKNTDLMGVWKMTSTPFSVYKDKFGKVMMLRGFPENVQEIVDKMKRP